MKGFCMRFFSITTRYIWKEFILSFFVAFLFFFFIFFINQILLLAEDILEKQVALFDVFLLIVYSLPSIIALSAPFGSLVGGLMAMGRFSSDNEVLAFRASGIPLRKMFIPILFAGTLLSVGSFFVNDYLLPLGSINFSRLYRELLYSAPELELESYSVKRYEDSTLITGRVEGNQINNMIIIDETGEEENRVILADRAFLEENEEQSGVISLNLEDILSQSIDPETENDFSYFESSNMIYNILLSNVSFSLQNPGPREMSSVDVYRAIQEKQAALNEQITSHEIELRNLEFELIQQYEHYTMRAEDPQQPTLNNDIENTFRRYYSSASEEIDDRSLSIYNLEFYKKFSVPAACLTFLFLALPAGLFTKRSGRSVGFGIGLFISVFYWGMLIAGQTLGLRMDFSPFLSMWLPNFIILFIGLLLMIIKVRQ
ncbi:MAG: LptF/LptG family permease [Spirochaetia bacterium]